MKNSKLFMENNKLKAVSPYIHPGFLNFKHAPFEAWERWLHPLQHLR